MTTTPTTPAGSCAPADQRLSTDTPMPAPLPVAPPLPIVAPPPLAAERPWMHLVREDTPAQQIAALDQQLDTGITQGRLYELQDLDGLGVTSFRFLGRHGMVTVDVPTVTLSAAVRTAIWQLVEAATR